jgi:hypothetical protein
LSTVHQRLIEVGIRIAAGADQPELRSECARLARLLRLERRRVVGLVPAGDDVAVPAVALQIGQALAEVAGSPVAVIDAHGSWPGVRALGSRRAADASLFATAWLLDDLALLTPRSFDTGILLPNLTAALADEAAIFDHLLVDLTGFDHLGEHLAVMQSLDGVIIVARSGRTRARQLEHWLRDIPSARSLGVLLTGV